jgi:CheY-like chemotaxis protein
MVSSILLVDDDLDDIDFFQEALGEVDKLVSFFSAKNGRRALELLSEQRTNRPDMIFLDINMPEMNGWNCLTELKKNPMLSGIPVVMYSTSASESEVEMASTLGAVGMYRKPDRFQELKNLIRRLIAPLPEPSVAL